MLFSIAKILGAVNGVFLFVAFTLFSYFKKKKPKLSCEIQLQQWVTYSFTWQPMQCLTFYDVSEMHRVQLLWITWLRYLLLMLLKHDFQLSNLLSRVISGNECFFENADGHWQRGNRLGGWTPTTFLFHYLVICRLTPAGHADRNW